ncbi:PHB depolymerase family esterase [Sphingomonas sp. NFR15]|uniref:extracellular catalytic domain type 1 short-chain-length polyhydroxyalkanoate depolymerase n=1 Tax=Sphingomonas sp. NFR15 TaxID=1566282 RepID=UPI00088AD974|nr:PHB depolymerase family esterase [Sphingomonas sp. NFR15]SDA17584.1 esterase, PHB depolymerase family [Sphingomonas sp. NFR15]
MALKTSMEEALRLTRSGKLLEATALLRSAFTRGGGAPAPAGAAGGTLIENVPFGRTKAAPDTTTAPGREARFEERSYSGPEGTMHYRLYRPAQARAGMPLIVMLHGCTQSPEDFARGTGMNRFADEHGFLVAYPRQTQAANAQKCWNWFKPGDQRRDRGEPALLAGVTRQVIAEERADPARVYVAGMSAGGAAAAIMAAEYPDLYAAVGIHSGLACGVARDLPSALHAMKRGGGTRATDTGRRFVPVITFHGDRDATVNEINSREIVAAAAAVAPAPLTATVETVRNPAGRSYTRETSADGRGRVLIERWTIAGSGHAWSGGDASGSYTDPAGPDASREMVRFFLERKRATV